MMSREVFDRFGNEQWFDSDGLLHRDNDLPAVTYRDGTQEWWVHGKLHRDYDLPAIISCDGIMEWWYEGLQHRFGDKPAYYDPLVPAVEYYHFGKLHRNGELPAVIYGNPSNPGYQAWYKNGVLSRVFKCK